MQGAFSEAEVDGYQDLTDSMTCHPKDRHVVAAAIRSGAGAIVTFNLSDFPDPAVDPYDIEVKHPDESLLDLLDLDPKLVTEELQQQARANRRSPRTLDELLDSLGRVDVVRFPDKVRTVVAQQGSRP